MSDTEAAAVGSSVRAVRTETKNVVLTYDDGPEPGGTERVLEALREHGVTATFFVLMGRVRRFPRLFAEMADEGHEVGLHGVDHRRLTSIDPREVRRRTGDARRELEDRLGSEVRWFRPPYGLHSRDSWTAVAATGLTTVLWTDALRDWWDRPTDTHLEPVLTAARPGTIMLAHDGFASWVDGVDDGRPPTLDRGRLTDLVIGAYRDQGLACCSLTEALDAGEPVIDVRLAP
ncbi:polysaccharide deacetylase family protein [Amycolatopsis sp. CA-128772]|uniref:polysaccharide deacetylase family protein n=1 Tax=Amycolatopsis sp. CA-128772 TaxID=2073159 RepID=UPI000CD142EA|nr:polysaccharide deacetylase family protein [Amycolatopsis sp. CA-128772]